MTKKRDANSHDEREALLAFLNHQRESLRTATYGLTDEQARSAPSASTLSLAGLLNHAAVVERNWTNILQSIGKTNGAVEHVASFQPGDKTLEELHADYREAADAMDAAVLAVPDLDFLAPSRPVCPGSPRTSRPGPRAGSCST